MLIHHLPLSFYVDRLRSGEPFAITKHSDASLYCMLGREGGDCNGCHYSTELREGLLNSIKYEGRGFYHGVQRLTDRDNEGFDQLLSNQGIRDRRWIDTGILASSLIDGKLYPLIGILRRLGVVVISNRRIRFDLTKIINYHAYVETPEFNTYDERERIYQEVASLEKAHSAIYLFSYGMAACAMIPVLHARYPHSSFIDMGHIWEALLGNKPRYYLKDLTPDHIARNLRP